MNEDQSYWYERGLHAGKVIAAEAQGYKEAYFALLETIAKNESLLPRQIILTTPQRAWVGLTDDEIYMNCPNWLSQEQCKVWIQQIEAKLKEKNT